MRVLLRAARADQPRAGARTRVSPVAFAIAIPTLLPVAVVLSALASPDRAVWQHLAAHVLPEVLANTLWLTGCVALVTGVLGTALAWLTVSYEFPGRRTFSWALMLPMAMPGYVIGFVVIGLLDYAGPVQSALRELAGPQFALPSIRSRAGVVAVMSLALYPYVYLLARNAFLTQGRQALEAAQSLGVGRRRGFWRVTLPLARPWIAGGVLLVAMETLADFGTVSVFNYDTFTTAIYEAWFSLFSLESALQLASVLMLLVLAALLVERALRARAAYTARDRQSHAQRLQPLAGPKRWLATGFAGTVLMLGFVIPFAQLLVWSGQRLHDDLDLRYVSFVAQSLGLSSLAALLITGVALALAYANRSHPGRGTRFLARIATVGYALPGTVLAVGVFVPIAALSGWLDGLIATVRGAGAAPLLLQSTLLTMLGAYLVRFLAVAHSPVESNLLRLGASLDEASRGLGVGGARMLWRVHLPLLRGGMATAATLVFVDVMKEMPITLMTRPFGWETLAVRVFEMTSEGEWERAALPAIAIALAGLIPVRLLMRRT